MRDAGEISIKKQTILFSQLVKIVLSVLFVCISVITNWAQTDAKFLIPSDKKLSADWISSLSSKGNPEIWKGTQLRYIGMPVGGIACGQLYLAGDGRLWLWDIFKSNYSREDVSSLKLDLMTMNGHYTKPVASDGGFYSSQNGARVEQGFAIRVKTKSENRLFTLDKKGFPEVRFRGEYPIGKIIYADKDCPVQVNMEAFSPFIPLDALNSALPATVFKFTVTNSSKASVDVDLMGWLQNAVCPYDSLPSLGNRQNTLRRQGEVNILFCDLEPANGSLINTHHGYGSMALSLISSDLETVRGNTNLPLPLTETTNLSPFQPNSKASLSLDKKLVGLLGQSFALKSGEKRSFTFLLTWHFPLHQEKEKGGGMARITDFKSLNRHYKPWFTDAKDVAETIASNKVTLIGNTLEWNKTWYNSTLPFWLLDRAIIPTDALATQTVHWFDNGRFWGWEGVESCEGTCTHVWNYAQALARLFPQLERGLRENVDYGVGFNVSTGGIGNRAENDMKPAVDGQAGTIMRTWREHTMSANNEFLTRIWPKTRKAIEWLISNDPSHQGIIEGAQSNTLDATWYGPMGWISSLYCGALRAGEQMANEMGDQAFADSCRTIADRGYQKITQLLFNGEYFIHLPPDYNKTNTNKGSHIDQVLGQSWASQYGLPRVLPKAETTSALNSIWKYNFAPDAGEYAIQHTTIKGHRVYSEPGEAGLLMTTWPLGGASHAVPGMSERTEDFETWIGPGGYFDETMTGFEYQVAAHMIYEGEPESELVMKGLAIARAVHDRYAPEKRNPFNEIECGDHYARAMAAYGVFLAVGGFEYHGPKGIISFNPKITPEDFKSAFVTAEGWGNFSQKREIKKQINTLDLAYGKLTLNGFNIQLKKGSTLTSVTVNGKRTKDFEFSEKTGRLTIKLNSVELIKGEQLQIICSLK